MKTLLTFLFLTLITLYNPQNVDYTSFSEFVNVHLRLPESVKRNCTWQYVIIKTTIDENNIITGYKVENKTITDLTNTFSYLKGYQFDKKINLRNHHFVFFLSLVSERVEDCDTPVSDAKNDAANTFQKYKVSHTEKGSKNIYMKEIITSLIYDSMK